MNLNNDISLSHCYFRINHKNKIELVSSLFFKEQQKKLLNLLEEQNKKIPIQSIQIFLNKILIKKGIKTSFDLSIYLALSYEKLHYDLKEKSNQYMNELFKIKKNIFANKNLLLSLDMIRKIGIIFFAGCNKLNSFKIVNESWLANNIQTMRSLEINILNDYNEYCYQHGNDPGEVSIEKVYDIYVKKRKYSVPPEFIFLENIFCNTRKLSIDFNWKDDFKNDDLDLLIGILLNKCYIFPQIVNINIEFNNYSLLKQIYEIYENILIREEKKIGNYINPINYDLELKNELSKKWTYESDFITTIDTFIDVSDLSIIRNNKERYSEFSELNNSYISSSYISIEDNFNKINSLLKSGYSIINRNQVEKTDKMNDIINKYKPTFISMFFLVGYISKIPDITNLSFSFTDNYKKEISIILKNDYQIEESFNFMDFFIFIKKYQNLSITFNSIDYESFEKFLFVIDNMKELKILNISFFTRDITYITPSLYKLYINLNTNNFSKTKQKHDEDIYILILKELLKKFEENLTNFFILFQLKEYIEEFGIYFDIPRIILSQIHYTMSINKFILNFLLNFDGDKNIKVLKILSPYSRFDCRTNPSIEELFEEIDYQKNNKKLEKLSLQIQFFNMKNICNLITTNLIFISIGDLDEISFVYLVNSLYSIKFTQNSHLKEISLKLLSMITSFEQIKLPLKKLFAISINSLKKIKLSTNLIFEDEKEFKDLNQIMNYNFFETYNLEINVKLNNEEKEKYSKELNYIKMNDNKRYIILRRLFKGKNKIIKECLKYLYHIGKPNIIYS